MQAEKCTAEVGMGLVMALDLLIQGHHQCQIVQVVEQREHQARITTFPVVRTIQTSTRREEWAQKVHQVRAQDPQVVQEDPQDLE
jgi:hypothetical protein